MKKIAFISIGILLSTLLYSQNFKNRIYPTIKSRTVIIGDVVNYKDFKSAPKSVKIFVNDVALGGFQIRYDCIVDENGKFHIDFPLFHQQDVLFDYTYRFDLFVKPNDTLYMKMKLYEREGKAFVAQGEFDAQHETFQQAFIKADRWLRNITNPWHEKHNWLRGTNPNDVKKLIAEFQPKVDSMIELEISTNKYPDLIANYLRLDSKYSFFLDMMKAKIDIKDYAERKEYLSFLDSINPYDSSSFYSSTYITFLNNYYYDSNESKIVNSSLPSIDVDKHLNFLFDNNIITIEQKEDYLSRLKNYKNYNDVFKELYKKYGKYIDVMFTLNTVNNIHKVRKGVYAEMLVANDVLHRIDDNYNSIAPFLPHILDSLQNDYMKEMIISKAKDEYVKQQKNNKIEFKEKSVENPDISNIYNIEEINIKDIFNPILKKHKGKVIYIDIWSTWCGPCIAEMEYSKILEEQFKGKPILFLYLCGSRSDETKWRDIIETYGLKGEHYFLNAEQWGFLKTKFNFLAIPRYILIDKDGTIINDNASKPRNEKTKEMLKKLIYK